jgi:hypothetical protein
MNAALGWRATVAEKGGYLGPKQYAEILSKGKGEVEAVRAANEARAGAQAWAANTAQFP